MKKRAPARDRDTGLDTFLDLDGQVLVIDEKSYWVKFEVKRVPVTKERPHGLDLFDDTARKQQRAPGRLR